MLKNYSDHTIVINIAGIIYLELPVGWSDNRFESDPEFEEFLRKRYPELNPSQLETETLTPKSRAKSKNKKCSKN
jgi:hypothetical protein